MTALVLVLALALVSAVVVSKGKIRDGKARKRFLVECMGVVDMCPVEMSRVIYASQDESET